MPVSAVSFADGSSFYLLVLVILEGLTNWSLPFILDCRYATKSF